MRKKVDKITKECRGCGKDFEVYPSQEETIHYHSKSCRTIHERTGIYMLVGKSKLPEDMGAIGRDLVIATKAIGANSAVRQFRDMGHTEGKVYLFVQNLEDNNDRS